MPVRQPEQPLGVLARRVHVDDRDRRGARRRRPPCPPCVPEHARLGPGELLEILELVLSRLAAEAAEAMLDVGRIARLRHLAVAYHADSGLLLPRDDIGGGALDRLVERALVDRLA